MLCIATCQPAQQRQLQCLEAYIKLALSVCAPSCTHVSGTQQHEKKRCIRANMPSRILACKEALSLTQPTSGGASLKLDELLALLPAARDLQQCTATSGAAARCLAALQGQMALDRLSKMLPTSMGSLCEQSCSLCQHVPVRPIAAGKGLLATPTCCCLRKAT